MSKGRIGVGLIGTGNIGRAHLTGLTALMDTKLINAEIAAICDTDSESLQQTSELFNVPRTYEDFNNLVADKSVDLVYICTPTIQHIDMVKAAANLEKNIFCEKPLAHSCVQARDMYAATSDAGVKAGVGLVMRYNQFLIHAKRLLKNNDFGPPKLAHIRDDQHYPIDHGYYSQWRGDRSIAGGGTLIEHSIHDIDIFRWFFGEVSSVFAKVGFYSGREIEDLASLIITHENGAVSTLDSIWHEVDRPSERVIEFFFEKGYIGITLESGKTWLDYQLGDEVPVRIHAETANLSLLEELGVHAKNLDPDALDALTAVGMERYSALSYSLINSIRNDEQPSPSFLDAIAAHRVVDAAYASSNKSRVIDLL
ncbi:MAG: gfo/Idh/MocA family oxidoreductase [Candidatus Thorarchaeota archaeon]|nr:gfo/Idh/MocA family oxidoreductase [Candidatus Thorarchaeota archaeon]